MELLIEYKELDDLQRQKTGFEDILSRLSSIRVFDRARLKRKINKLTELHKHLEMEFYKKLDTVLHENDIKYSTLLDDNKKLLIKNEYLLKVYMTDGGLSSTELSFKGHISEKGFLYLFAQETNICLRGWDYGLMSKIFDGSFDEYGNYTANSSEMDDNLILPQIPNCYKGFCSDDMSFHMEAIETDWDITGHEFVDKIICDPFNESHHDRMLFLNNRTELKNIKTRYLTELKSAST